ncbi:MAG: ABC transporter ATP-binding protein, partial [bacterium]
LLGPNGAGKTTALRLIMGLLTPNTGSVEVFGENPRANPDVKREVGYLTADMGLYGRLTPRESLAFFGRLYGLEDGTLDRRIREVVERLEIGPFLERRCETLSTGMKQRVLLARALLPDPRVLILDEPTAGLDAVTALDFINLLKQDRATGKAILFSTHQLWEAEILADRIGILHQGELGACGQPADLLQEFGSTSLLDLFLKIVHGQASPLSAEAAMMAGETQ